MTRFNRPPIGGAILVLALGTGCAGDSDGSREPSVTRTTPAVRFTAPADDAVIDGDRVTVRLEAIGVAILPAGTDEPNSGHHHLFIDRAPSHIGEVIPAGEGIVHLGGAQSEFVFEGLAPGEHRVIAALGDFQHVRLASVAADTVRFTVSGR